MNDDWYKKGLCMSLILVVLGMLSFMIAGCLQQMDRTTPFVWNTPREISPKNTIIVNLPAGEKLQTLNWERTSNNRRLYILTRPMHSDEIPEVYKYYQVDNDDRCYEIHESEVETSEDNH